MKIMQLRPLEVTRLMADLSEADLNGRTVRVAIDRDGFKYKIGEGMWTPSLGFEESE